MSYVCCLLEASAILTLIYGLEENRKKFNVIKSIVYLSIYLVSYTVIYYWNLSGILSVIHYVLLFVYIKWAYEEDLLRTFTLMVISLVFVSCLEMFFMWALDFFIQIKVQIGYYEFLMVLLSLLTCVFIRKLHIYRVVQMLDKWEFSYSIVSLLSLMIFTPVTIVKVVKTLEFGDYFYIVICIFTLWLMLSRVQKYKLEAKIRKQYFEGYSNVISQIRKRQHKVKNQFNTAFGMYRLYDTYEELVERQREYLGKVWDYELPTDAITLEEPAIVALIYEKINEAIDKGIEIITTFSCSMLKTRISDIEWVEILGTLLDNAIEALESYEGKKKIWIKIVPHEKHHICIEVVNTYEKVKSSDLEKFFQKGYSTKGEERGIGLYHVKQVIRKNKGEIFLMSHVLEDENVISIQIVL